MTEGAKVAKAMIAAEVDRQMDNFAAFIKEYMNRDPDASGTAAVAAYVVFQLAKLTTQVDLLHKAVVELAKEPESCPNR